MDSRMICDALYEYWSLHVYRGSDLEEQGEDEKRYPAASCLYRDARKVERSPEDATEREPLVRGSCH